MFQGSFKGVRVQWVFPECFQGVFRVFQGCFKEFQGCLKGVYEGLKGVSRIF